MANEQKYAESSINRHEIMGRLGKDAEVKFTPTGKAYARFSVATSQSWKDDAGKIHTATEWHNIVLWRNAEKVGGFLTKGKRVYLEGRSQTREYETEGQKRRTVEVIADRLILLSFDREEGPARQSAPARSSGASAPDDPWDGQGIGDDDVPF